MAKQLKKFCRITKYIEKTDPKLYEILDDLCMLGAFRPRRGHSGTTFLWPSKDTVSDLDKMRYTDDIDKGCDIVLAHIVHDYLPNAAAWNSKKSDIPNGSSKKVDVKAVAGSKVTLADGAELEHDDRFRTFRTDGENQTVWRVVKGKIDPSKHTKPATNEFAREGAPRPRPPKADGGARHRTFHHRVGGSLISYVLGGAKHASAPFGWLVAFFNYVNGRLTEAKDSDADILKMQITELRIIYSPEMVSTCAFLTREDSGLEHLIEDFKNDEDAQAKIQIHGSKDYLGLVAANHRALNANKSGGAVGKDDQAVLGQIISACLEGSRNALKGVKVSPKFDEKVFTALNLSRYLEHLTLKHIPDHAELRKDKAGAIQDMIEIIHGRANMKGVETDTKTQSLGALVASLLSQLKKFKEESGYATYPLGDQHVFATSQKQCEAIYGPDTSVSALLSRMTPDQLSELFSNLGDSIPVEGAESEEIKESESEDVAAPED
jgi:hypothetical protein